MAEYEPQKEGDDFSLEVLFLNLLKCYVSFSLHALRLCLTLGQHNC